MAQDMDQGDNAPALTVIPKESVLAGHALPVFAYDETGVLMLRRGDRGTPQHVLARMLSKGLYTRTGPAADAPQSDPSPVASATTLDLLGEAEHNLARAFQKDLGAHFPRMIGKLAHSIQVAVETDIDAAIATTLLDSTARYSVKHSLDTAIMTDIALRALGVLAADRLSAVAAALTMNISIAALQDTLYTQAAPLDADQQEAVRHHSVDSYRYLRQHGVDDPIWLEAVLHHHESLDGRGYPHGLAWGEIGLASRAINLIDVFCAMICNRSYRNGMLPAQAMRKLLDGGRDKYDPEIMPALVNSLGVYPPGTVVRLQNGETAMVSRRSNTILFPMAMAIVDPYGNKYANPLSRDTRQPGNGISGSTFLRRTDIRINPWQIWGKI